MAQPREREHPIGLIILLGGLVAFGPLSIDMYLPAFPAMALSFGASQAEVQLSLSSFFIGIAAGQLIYGPITDRFGRKPPLYFSLVSYALMATGCAFSPDIRTLVGFRFLQAFGVCGAMVIARAIVRDLFAPQQAARVFSRLILIMGAAPILAPLVGGYVAAIFGWRAIFFIQAALGIVATIGARVVLPETSGPNPAVQLRNFFKTYVQIGKSREFMGYALAGGLGHSGMFAYIAGSPFVFISLFHVPAEQFGWIFGANAFGLIAISQINAWLLRSYSLDLVLRKAFAALALFAMAVMIAGTTGIGPVFLGLALFSYIATLGMTSPNSSAGALARQEANAGSAAALMGSLQFGCAFLASLAVGRLHDGSARPMALVLGLCGIAAFLVHRLIIVPTQPRSS